MLKDQNKGKSATKIQVYGCCEDNQFYCSLCHTRLKALDKTCSTCGAVTYTDPMKFIIDEDFMVTEKQRKFASFIQSVTGKPIPEDRTKESYRQYISNNIDEFNEKKDEYYIKHMLKRGMSRSTSNIDNPYVGPYGTEIVDCYDFGVFPYGDS